MKTVFIIAEHAHINGKPANYELNPRVYIYIYIFFFFQLLLCTKYILEETTRMSSFMRLDYGKSKEDKLLAKKISAYFVSFQQHCWPVRWLERPQFPLLMSRYFPAVDLGLKN